MEQDPRGDIMDGILAAIDALEVRFEKPGWSRCATIQLGRGVVLHYWTGDGCGVAVVKLRMPMGVELGSPELGRSHRIEWTELTLRTGKLTVRLADDETPDDAIPGIEDAM